MTQVAYRKDDVYIAKFAGSAELLAIKEVCGDYVRHNYGWENGKAFHARVHAKYGVVRRICGIPFGYRRTP